MRINHNIAALNTYRQLQSNSTQQQNSLEKLSSGMRINSAADDAAGLAISEKMRAQIRGLEQAQSNAQDGISMIQTAEGALNETHSILQRMRELATQSANDTNVDVDRGEIQKEINQLTTELNRIGNTTEFNTQTLLDGGTSINANAATSADSLTGGLDTGTVDTTVNETSLGVDAVAETWSAQVTADIADTESNTVTFMGAEVTISGTSSGGAAASASSDTAATVEVDTDSGTLSNDIATALKDAFEAMRDYDDGDTSDNALAGFTFNDNTDTLEVTDTLANGDTNTAENIAVASGGSLKLGGGVSVSSESTGVDAVAANGDISFDQNDGVPAEGSKITVANKTIAFYNSNSGNFDDADHAKTSLSADYVVDTYGITNGQGIAQAVVDEVNNDPISGYQVTVDGANADQVNVDATSTGVSGLSAGELVNSTAPTDTAATGSITFSDTPTEGSTVTIGNESIGFYDSTSGNYSDANEAKTELSTDYVIDINGKSTVNDIKDSVLALDPQMSQVNLADGGIGQIDITVASTGAAGNQVQLDSTENETTGFKTNFQIGANNGQSFQMDISDMRANALGVSGDTAGADHSSVAGAMFTSTQNVTNGTNNTATEYAMDVTTHDKASAAVEVVNDAIEQVSAQRSALGAYQNRLEHTINNLGTSAENLTSAESRIRDTDMAKEMMNFTKQNILSQAAQSMLAQANQMPQGVLKLLQ